jgi:transposase
MMKQRKQYSPKEKVRILREHLVEKVPVSDLCDRHGLRPNLFYRWQKQFFENGAAAFEHNSDAHERKMTARVQSLQTRLAGKDEVIAEIMADYVCLKKNLGEI